MLHPGDRIGDWEIVLPLGQGGMGSVYRCRHALTERIEAAVKVLKPTDAPGARERFIREAEALHSLRHPGIVRIAGFGQDAATGLLWLAMELVEGQDFERLLHGRAFPRERTAAVFGTLADGLAYAHSRGIVHRDIKPGNLMLQADGVPVLLDFGIAVQEGQDRLTREGVVPGTVAYAAPEQVTVGGAADPALADLYALGQVLNECLTGRVTYPRTAGMDAHRRSVRILRQKLKAEPLDPGEGFAAEVRALVRGATEPDPARRGPPLSQWAAILAAGPLLDEEATASLGPAELAPVASEPAPPPPAPDASPPTDQAAPRGSVWMGLIAAALVVLLGSLLLGLTAAGGVAAWWRLSSAPPPPRADVPLGEVLGVDAGEAPEATPDPAAAPADATPFDDPALAPTAETPTAEAAPPSPQAAPSPRPTVAGDGEGRLVVASDIAAAVHIDGTYVRDVPMTRPIAAGSHRVELVAPDGRRKSFSVVVDPGEKVRRVWSFADGQWRSFDGGLDEATLPARPANVGDAARLLRSLPDTSACLIQADEDGPLTVVFTVAPDGSVVAEGLRDPAHRGTELEACLERAARKLTFGASSTGAAVSVEVGG